MGLYIFTGKGKVHQIFFFLNNFQQEVLECQAVVLKYLELTRGNWRECIFGRQLCHFRLADFAIRRHANYFFVTRRGDRRLGVYVNRA